MMAGRKRKAGKRTKSGQLSRAGQSRVKPSDRVQEQLDKFGNHYSSALGRAYASGLLGTGMDAKTRLDAGNKFALRYSKTFQSDAYTCPLDDTVRGPAGEDPDQKRAYRQEQWLFRTMDDLDALGLRPWLDQLIHKNYTDQGPTWLDALLDERWTAAHKADGSGKWKAGQAKGKAGDLVVLDAAIRALDLIAGYDVETVQKSVDIPLHMCNGAVNA